MNDPITGTITDIFPAEIYGSFEKRIFWLKETNRQYPSHFAFELWQGDVNITDNFKVGQEVTVKFELRGKSWNKNGKAGIINTLKCISMVRAGKTEPVPSTRQQTGGIPHQQKAPPPPASQEGYTPYQDNDSDELPF